MPRQSLHNTYLRTYVLYMLARDIILDSDSETDSDQSSTGSDFNMPILDDDDDDLELDLEILKTIRNTRYLNGWTNRLPSAGNIHFAWIYSEQVEDHMRFMRMLRVSPPVFDLLVSSIKDHPVFRNNSNVPQTPVDIQLAVTLYRMGRYGNGASVEDIRRSCGVSVGSVELFTERCFDALKTLHDHFVRSLTPHEKEVEKRWIDDKLGFTNSLWRDGYLMYDGTIAVLYAKPGWNGDAYYTHKSNHGLNVQV